MSDASAVVSPLRPKLLEPGLPALDAGVECYGVRGGGAIALVLEPGDLLEIVDTEGRQPAELVVFSPDGREDAGAAGARAAHEPAGLHRILSEPGEDAQRVRAALEGRGLDLDRGAATGLDATTTRTLMGAAYPGPGLHSKCFDRHMQPLVEVIRDTVGRHDAFNLACTARYYEDMGYFGHANCSTNFNAALAPFAGYELDDQTDPFETGIGFAVALNNEEDFIGRAALLRKAHPQRRLVGLKLVGNETAAPGDCVHVGRAQVGSVTSATRSPVLRKNIALARLAVEHAEPGTEVEVGKLDGHQKRLPATVVRFPFYDPDKTRVRA